MLNNITSNKFLLSICLTLLFVASFAFFSSTLQNRIALAEEVQSDSIFFTNVSTIIDASNITGYNVSTISKSPDGLTNYNISVSDVSKSNNEDKRVTQIWSDENKEQLILLVQDPTLIGIGDGVAASINGSVGQKTIITDEKTGVSMLILFWEKDDMGYVIQGTLNEKFNENYYYDLVKLIN